MKSLKRYYEHDTTPTVRLNREDMDWLLASDIQKEIKNKYGKYVSLIVIGKTANQYNLVRNTTYGFKLYHKDLIDILGK